MSENKFKLIYILPNLFTSASVFFGIVSIIASINHNFNNALMYILLALICDGLDGRVARATGTATKFGVEFDSLADIVSFGVAPALFFYCVVGFEYGRLGALVAGLYVVFGAIRLARFNVTTATNEPSVFIGLPIPTAAVVSVLWVYFYSSLSEPFAGFAIILLITQILMGILMVSNIRYPSFKKIDFRKTNALKVLVVLVLVLSFCYLYFIESLVAITSAYVLYGLLRAAKSMFKAHKNNNPDKGRTYERVYPPSDEENS